jgi:spore coat polysaccharide biosynthesis protein SpsF
MTEDRTIAIILARMGSSRLPGKTLMKLNGTPLLKRIYDRVCKISNVDKVIVATSTSYKDDELEAFCINNSIPVFRGDEEDVLGRFYQCASQEDQIQNLSSVVRITADEPFVDPGQTEDMISFLIDNNLDYIHNRHLQGPPLGFHAEVISFNALKNLNSSVTDKEEREHVTLHILKPENRGDFKIKLFDAPENLRRPQYRLVIDQSEDFELVSKIYKALGDNPDTSEVINFLDNNPEIANINKGAHLDFKEILDK